MSDIYEKIINDPEFLDLLWSELTPENKYNALTKYGFNLIHNYEDLMKNDNE